jgi:hypothetical protein
MIYDQFPDVFKLPYDAETAPVQQSSWTVHGLHVAHIRTQYRHHACSIKMWDAYGFLLTPLQAPEVRAVGQIKLCWPKDVFRILQCFLPPSQLHHLHHNKPQS